MALPAPDPPLADGLVSLRAIAPGDLAAVERAFADPDIVRWFGDEEPAAQTLRSWIEAWQEGSAAAFAVCDAAGGVVAGHVLIELRNSGRAHLEYWLLPEWRGRGMATRALLLAARYAFTQLGRVRLELWTEPENIASQRLVERAGFRREGVLRGYSEINGRRVDAVFFGRLAGDPDPGQ